MGIYEIKGHCKSNLAFGILTSHFFLEPIFFFLNILKIFHEAVELGSCIERLNCL